MIHFLAGSPGISDANAQADGFLFIAIICGAIALLMGRGKKKK